MSSQAENAVHPVPTADSKEMLAQNNAGFSSRDTLLPEALCFIGKRVSPFFTPWPASQKDPAAMIDMNTSIGKMVPSFLEAGGLTAIWDSFEKCPECQNPHSNASCFTTLAGSVADLRTRLIP
jgi:hypothetical protein